MSLKRKNVKHLRFELTTQQWANFWFAVEKLNEKEKLPAFLKMIDIILKERR